jgi:hypothetical protein
MCSSPKTSFIRGPAGRPVAGLARQRQSVSEGVDEATRVWPPGGGASGHLERAGAAGHGDRERDRVEVEGSARVERSGGELSDDVACAPWARARLQREALPRANEIPRERSRLSTASRVSPIVRAL